MPGTEPPTGGRGLTDKGAARLGARKPLIGESKALSSDITYQIAGKDSVEIGSLMEHTSTQDLGAKQGAFGRDRRNHPIPWSDIPPRPFLGIGDQTRNAVLEILPPAPPDCHRQLTVAANAALFWWVKRRLFPVKSRFYWSITSPNYPAFAIT